MPRADTRDRDPRPAKRRRFAPPPSRSSSAQACSPPDGRRRRVGRQRFDRPALPAQAWFTPRRRPGWSSRPSTTGCAPNSAAEAAAVAALAGRLGMEHRTLRWEGPKPSSGIAAAARLARYRLLAEAAGAAGTDIAAHRPHAGRPAGDGRHARRARPWSRPVRHGAGDAFSRPGLDRAAAAGHPARGAARPCSRHAASAGSRTRAIAIRATSGHGCARQAAARPRCRLCRGAARPRRPCAPGGRAGRAPRAAVAGAGRVRARRGAARRARRAGDAAGAPRRCWQSPARLSSCPPKRPCPACSPSSAPARPRATLSRCLVERRGGALRIVPRRAAQGRRRGRRRRAAGPGRRSCRASTWSSPARWRRSPARPGRRPAIRGHNAG